MKQKAIGCCRENLVSSTAIAQACSNTDDTQKLQVERRVSRRGAGETKGTRESDYVDVDVEYKLVARASHTSYSGVSRVCRSRAFE